MSPKGQISTLEHIEAEIKWTPFHRRHTEYIFLNENIWIPNKILLKFVAKCPINNIPAWFR